MEKVMKLLGRSAKNEQGITGLETAIILIAFVVVATIFAFVVLTTGVFSAERGKETVFAGLEKARGSMEIRGGVVVTATGTTLAVDDIQFAVATSAGGEPVRVTEDAHVDFSPVWTPDGRSLLFVSNRGGGRDIYRITVADMSPERGTCCVGGFSGGPYGPVG